MRNLRHYRRRNGRLYRKFRGGMGRVYWIEMSQAEVRELRLYRAAVALMPLAAIWGMAWVAGMI